MAYACNSRCVKSQNIVLNICMAPVTCLFAPRTSKAKVADFLIMTADVIKKSLITPFPKGGVSGFSGCHSGRELIVFTMYQSPSHELRLPAYDHIIDQCVTVHVIQFNYTMEIFRNIGVLRLYEHDYKYYYF